jgi:hypothetical protein
VHGFYTFSEGLIKVGQDLSNDYFSPPAELMDHSTEFVALVYQTAPEAYENLMKSEQVRKALEQDNNLNCGKIYAFAEYVVFRREFMVRFPEASAVSCINAFSKLFLKNDISITNLVDYMEAGPARVLLLDGSA